MLPYAFRFFSAALNLSAVFYIGRNSQEELSNSLFYYQFSLIVSSGWCTLSYRQNLHATLATIPVRKYGFLSYASASVAIALIASLLTRSTLSTESLVLNIYIIFIFCIAAHASTIAYTSLWIKNRLAYAYLLDSLPAISMLIGAIAYPNDLRYAINTWITTYATSVAITCTFLYFKLSPKLPSLNGDSAMGWLNAQLIVLISYAEIFLLKNLLKSNQITDYRIILSITMATVMIVSVFRQTLIAKGVTKWKSKKILYLATANALISPVLLTSNYIASIWSTGIFFVISCSLQILISFNMYTLYTEGKTWICTGISILTLALASTIVYHNLKVGSHIELMQVKIFIINTNTILMLIAIFYSSRMTLLNSKS